VAVVTDNGGTPCGACRQVLSEFGQDTLVLLADSQGRLISETLLRDLLPGAFGAKDLEKRE
jgi:cytidine deaminase